MKGSSFLSFLSRFCSSRGLPHLHACPSPLSYPDSQDGHIAVLHVPQTQEPEADFLHFLQLAQSKQGVPHIDLVVWEVDQVRPCPEAHFLVVVLASIFCVCVVFNIFYINYKKTRSSV